jgi:hypothetical protein
MVTATNLGEELKTYIAYFDTKIGNIVGKNGYNGDANV